MINWNLVIAWIQIAVTALMFGIGIRYFVDRVRVNNSFSKLEKIKLEKWRHGVFSILSLVILIASLIGYHLQHQRLDLLASIYFSAFCLMNLIAYLLSVQEFKKELKLQ